MEVHHALQLQQEGRYTPRMVERLIGLHEGVSNTGARHVTIADILSWARDPGGAHIWLDLVRSNDPRIAWMARRGPLDPESPVACILWDFLRAMKRLTLFEQAVVALTVMGFSPTEIGAVIDPDAVVDPAREHRGRYVTTRELARRRKRVARALEGTPARDAEGQPMRDESGDVIYRGGVVRRLARMMSGDGR